MTPNLIGRIKKRDKLHLALRTSPNNAQLTEQYKIFRNQVEDIIGLYSDNKIKLQSDSSTKLSTFEKTDSKTIKFFIEFLKTKTAAGNDQIPSKFIKDHLAVLLGPIIYLVNLSLNPGCFPKIFKEAIIRSKHKGGNPEQAVDYRPIALVSNVAKILKKVVKTQLSSFLENAKIFCRQPIQIQKK